MVGFKNLNWDIHQNDPDNWIKIPEFNVKPQDVNFVGFAYPILGAEAGDFIWKVPIFDAVHAVRSKARGKFNSLSELKAAYSTALHSDHFWLDSAVEVPVSWSDTEVFAFRYESFMYGIERAMSYYKHRKDRCVANLASAMCFALDISSNKPLDPQSAKAVRTAMAKSGAKAMLANSEKQIDKKAVFECWTLWQQTPTRYAGKTAFARDMLDKFSSLTSIEVISRWCREWEGTTKQAEL